jgi:hypothetical protein
MAALGWLLNLGFAAGGTAATIPSVLGDLTYLWTQKFQPAVHAAGAARNDDTTLARIDIDANGLGYDGEEDVNTALAKYFDTEF